MIVGQGYPMWALLRQDKQPPTAEPIIAWRILEEDAARPPAPIGVYGEMDLGRVYGFYADKAAIDRAIGDIAREMRAAEGRREPPHLAGRDALAPVEKVMRDDDEGWPFGVRGHRP